MPVTGDRVTGVREVFDASIRWAKHNLSRAAARPRACGTLGRRASCAPFFQEIFDREGNSCGLTGPPDGGRQSASLTLVFFFCPTEPRAAQAVTEKSLRRIKQSHSGAGKRGALFREDGRNRPRHGWWNSMKGKADESSERPASARLRLRRRGDPRLRTLRRHLARMHPERRKRRAADSVGCQNSKSQRSQRCANQHQHIHCVLHSE